MPGVVTSLKVKETEASQASEKVGGTKVGVVVQFTGVVCVAQVSDGGVLSTTTTERLQVAVLPQSSVAVHVLVTVYVPGHVPGVELSENVMATV